MGSTRSLTVTRESPSQSLFPPALILNPNPFQRIDPVPLSSPSFLVNRTKRDNEDNQGEAVTVKIKVKIIASCCEWDTGLKAGHLNGSPSNTRISGLLSSD